MDVAFQMRGVPDVVLVDACRSGSEPGAIFRVPGSEARTTSSLDGDQHALSFRWGIMRWRLGAAWLLKDEYPKNITVYLIEAEQLEFGAPLSSPSRSRSRQTRRTCCSTEWSHAHVPTAAGAR